MADKKVTITFELDPYFVDLMREATGAVDSDDTNDVARILLTKSILNVAYDKGLTKGPPPPHLHIVKDDEP